MRMKFTTAGRSALVNATNTGTNGVLVTQIGVTEPAFIPDPAGSDLVLPGERKRLTTFGGLAVADDVVHVTVRDDSDDVYSLRGIGLYLDDGTLLCVYGQQNLILEKSAQAMMLLAADLMLADMDARQIQFGSADFIYPPATVEVQGVIELATQEEAVEGRDRDRAITPAALKATLDERMGADAPTVLSKQMLAAATEAAMRALLEIKSAALKDEGAGHGLDADLLDGQEGAYYLAYENLTGRPRSFLLPGQIVVMATPQPPTGLLACNGTAVSRADYAELFAAIGTTYGAGDGQSTFNLPAMKADTVPVHTMEAGQIGSFTAGAVISHGHTATTGAAGDHTHYTAVAGAGGHGHGASADGGGDHIHVAWTDAQGHHGHGGATHGGGAHSHVTVLQNNGALGNPNRGGACFPQGVSGNHVEVGSSGVGDHAHGLAIDGAGNHAHNIGMNGVGNHSHGINIAAGGHHDHPVDHRGAGAHDHQTSIGATGGQDNLPAGLRMMYCIAY